MLFVFHLFAQQATDQPKGPSGSPFDPTFLLPILAIGVLFYFLMIRPQRRQEKERQALLSALKKNDKVVTSGGIIGIVASVNEKQDEVTLKVDESSNVRLKVTKSSIARVLTPEAPAKEQKEGGA
jgi:preprotein translocase subunit YajC